MVVTPPDFIVTRPLWSGQWSRPGFGAPNGVEGPRQGRAGDPHPRKNPAAPEMEFAAAASGNKSRLRDIIQGKHIASRTIPRVPSRVAPYPFKEKNMPQVRAHILENAAQPAEAQRYLALKLSLEANVAEVYEAKQANETGMVLVDARDAESFAKGHIPGSINLNAKDITTAAVASLDKNAVYVTYCGGPACNASTKTAEKLAGLGFKVKEFSGGLPKWQEKGYSVQTGA